MKKTFQRWSLAVAAGAVLLATLPQPARAAADVLLARGQTVYVPVYSNIFTAPKAVPIHLANILTIRNTDLRNAIRVTSADYYDTKGTLVRKYYQTSVTLAPMETTYVYLSERDQEGGFGANFIVRWQADKDVNVPIIECLMIGNEGRAFVSPGQAIREETK
ncbi:MAG: DUF3124 domain-containing protein [Desulfuromonas sp.]|nr:DUF3124 domain-containing protein [Desulfuromonas sp.]